MKNIIALLIMVFALTFVSEATAQQIRYVRSPFVKFGARYINGQPTITINSFRARLMGPQVTNFFVAHEQAHFRLGHFHQRGRKSIRRIEAEADTYAYRSVSPQSARAASRWFATRPLQIQGRQTHGTFQQRANRYR